MGFLGGKTQTDIAGMDDLYLDGAFANQFLALLIANAPVSSALGISDEVEMLGLKGSKKRRSKKLDEDYMVCLASTVILSVPQPIFSQSLSLSLRRTLQRLFKQFGRHKARKSFSSFLPELRYAFRSTMLGSLIDFP